MDQHFIISQPRRGWTSWFKFNPFRADYISITSNRGLTPTVIEIIPLRGIKGRYYVAEYKLHKLHFCLHLFWHFWHYLNERKGIKYICNILILQSSYFWVGTFASFALCFLIFICRSYGALICFVDLFSIKISLLRSSFQWTMIKHQWPINTELSSPCPLRQSEWELIQIASGFCIVCIVFLIFIINPVRMIYV